MRHLTGWEAILAVQALAVLAFPLAVHADIIYTNADSYVESNHPEATHGSDILLHVVSVDNGAIEAHTYLNFDVTNAVPAGYTFQSATLRLAIGAWSRAVSVEAYRASGPWDEATLTWSNRPGHEAAGLDSKVVTFQDYIAVWKSWDVSAGWPGTGDFGLVMVMSPSPNFAMSFYSRELTAVPRTPYLDVQYTKDTSVPEPASLSLAALALAGLGLARRRRRQA